MKITTVDAFTNKPFSGNPAGVCITEKPIAEDLMQKIANELNLAETAFVYPVDKGFHLRWFTPTTEVQLCGHATLAASHALWEQNVLSVGQTAIFQTLSGELTAVKRDNLIELDFPAIEMERKIADDYIKEALDVNIKDSAYNKKGFWIAEVDDEETVRRIKPDLKLITKTNSVFIVTAKSKSSKYDFVSRVFVPAFGIDEDPVTGAAHCGLAPYWSKILGKNEFSAYQASQRGGELNLKLVGDRVKLIGEAVTVLSGDIKI